MEMIEKANISFLKTIQAKWLTSPSSYGKQIIHILAQTFRQKKLQTQGPKGRPPVKLSKLEKAVVFHKNMFLHRINTTIR